MHNLSKIGFNDFLETLPHSFHYQRLEYGMYHCGILGIGQLIHKSC